MSKKRITLSYIISGILFLLFALLIVLLKTVDIKAIGPESSAVGLATVNKAVFDFFSVNFLWYTITDYLGFVAFAAALFFAIIGLVQIIKRKSLKKVDPQLLALGAYYIIVITFYLFFEKVVINYRPIILNSNLEPSFPSSHTMLVLTIMSTAMLLFPLYFKKKALVIALEIISLVVIAVTVIGRLISGVHWFTDILGGILLGSALFMLYYAVINTIYKYSQI